MGAPLRFAGCHKTCTPQSSSLQLPVLFSLASRSFVAKLNNPFTAMLGSPANSLGSVLSQFLSHHTKSPSRKSKTPPKPQRKRHCRLRFLILRQLPPSGLGRTRSRLALRSLRFGCNPFVPHSLHPSPIRAAQGCFSTRNPLLSAGSKHIKTQKETSWHQKPKKAKQS